MPVLAGRLPSAPVDTAVEGPDEHHSTRSPALLRRLALLTVVGSVVAFVAVWYVFIRTNDGRRFENFVWDSRRVMDPRIRRTQNDALNLVTEVTLGVGLVVILLLGVVRRTWFVAFVTCVGIGGATVSTQVLKRIVINRPPTIGELARISANSFPSGHATICTAVALGALLMTGQHWRRLAMVLAAVWVAFQCTGVVTSGWHRPSDTLAGYAVALAWMASAVWVLAATGQVSPQRPRPLTSARTRSLILGVAGLSVLGLLVGVSVGGDSAFSRGGAAYVLSILVLTLCGLLTVWWFWELLDGWHVGGRSPLGGPERPSVPSADGAGSTSVS